MQTEQPIEDFLSVETQHERASTGIRFANHLIDLLLFYGLFFLTGVLIALESPDSLEALEYEGVGYNLLDRLLTLFLFGLYIGATEAIFKGKTLGKLITGTRAVTLDGRRISVGTAFLRGFSRAVPFEPFSAFGGNPWHDRWTDTMVVVERK